MDFGAQSIPIFQQLRVEYVSAIYGLPELHASYNTRRKSAELTTRRYAHVYVSLSLKLVHTSALRGFELQPVVPPRFVLRPVSLR